MDVLQDADALVRAGETIEQLSSTLLQDDDAQSEVAQNAITPAMLSAMMGYMPLRNMLSYGATEEQLQGLLLLLNGK